MPDAIVAISSGASLHVPALSQVEAGCTIWQTAPPGVHVCRLNGLWLSRRDWDRVLDEGDVVEWHEVPQDRNTLRTALQIAVAIAAIYVPGAQVLALQGWQAAAASVAISTIGNLAVNALLPIQQQQMNNGAAPDATYSTALAGNQARLYGPIPKILGAHQFYPPFACQPYTRFDDNDQYYYALFAVGVGGHDVIRAQIDDTDLNRFADVLVSRYLPPGTAPSDVIPSVVTAPEVVGAEMQSGRYIGGFAACGPRLVANSIEIDVVAPRGLIDSAGGKSVSWRVESRPIDDFGSPLAPWSVLANETRSANTNTAQRWTSAYTISPAARVEVRAVRTDTKDTAATAAHEIQWAGLRAFLTPVAPLNPNVAHYELVMRASEQLSGLSQRRFALIVAGHARTWSPATGWGAYAATRNPAWLLAELWSNPVWGEGLPDSRIDLPSLAALAATCEARQDRCDYVLAETMDAWECAQLIARTARARVFRRGGVYTVARDQLATLPATAFSPRNCTPGSMSMSETVFTPESPDGLVVEYFDNRSWEWREVLQPLPGVTTVTRPAIIRLQGVTGLQHARREALYEAAALLYRTRSVGCVTEMQGMLPAYLQAVLWQPDMAGYGSTGDVAGQAGAVLTLSEPVPADSTRISLIRDDGTLWTADGSRAGEYTFQAASVPPFALNIDGGLRERTKYLIGVPGVLGRQAEVVRIAAISDGGREGEAQLWRIDATIDDDRVHTADLALLPGAGVVQDPIDDGSTSGEGAAGIIVVLNNGEWEAGAVGGQVATCSITLSNTGTLVAQLGPITSTVPGQWTPAAPLSASEAALWEVRAQLIDGTAPTSGTLNAWLPLSSSVTWTHSLYIETEDEHVFALLKVQIRDIAGATVQADANLRIAVSGVTPPSTGG